MIPDLPDVDDDKVFSYMHSVPGPDKIVDVAVAASEAVRVYLRQYMKDPAMIDQLRFESLLLPFMFEARRIGDIRGQAREKSMFAGLFPGTE